MKRRALGKGLGTLLPEKPVAGVVEEGYVQIEVSRIQPNPSQPRESFDEEELEDLAQSIKEAGVLQPVLVRRSGDGFELIAGERRWRAARRAGLERIPAMIQQVGQERSLELALIENIQRQQLNPIEEARAFSTLMTQFGLTQEDVAVKVGRKRPSVANSLRLLRLPAEVQSLVREGRITAGHAKALLSLSGDKEILAAARKMSSGEVTVRKAEQLTRARKPGGSPHQDPNVRDAEIRLQRALGTKVRIKTKDGEKGRVEIEFYSGEELQRIFEILEGHSG